MNSRFTIVGLGEALYDVFPDAQILGGAPLNVAVHANQLAKPRDGAGVVVSRVGQDALGQGVADELTKREMACDYLQTDPDHATGQVYVSIDSKGQPSYEIVSDVAWDWLQYDPDTESLAHRCDAVCFGSLAQRCSQTRNTIYRFVDATRPAAVRMFDVNLRQDYYNASIIRKSLELANVLKLNEDELPIVCDLLAAGSNEDAPQKRAQLLLKKFDLALVVYTRGAQGTMLITADESLSDSPVAYPPAESADAVGAGDACTAAVLVGRVLRLPLDKTLKLANHAGAYVASQPGATPTLSDDVLGMLG